MAPWELSNKSFRIVLVCLFMAFLGGFNNTILMSSIDVLKDSFGCNFTFTIWLMAITPVSAIMFSFISIDIADKFGKRNCSVLGLSIIVIGSILSFFSTDMYMLISFRVVTGAGIALIIAPNNSIIADNVGKKYLPEVLAFNYAMSCVGGALGPIVGHYMTYSLGWNSVFILFAVVSLTAVFVMMEVDNMIVNPDKKINYFAHTLFIVSTCMLLNSYYMYWEHAYIGYVGGALLVIFIIWQWRSKEDRIIDTSIFKNKLFTMSVITGFLFLFAVYCIDDMIVLFMQETNKDFIIAGSIVVSTAVLSALLRGMKPALQCIFSPIFARVNRGANPMKLTIIGLSLIVFVPILYAIQRLIPDDTMTVLILISIYVILSLASAIFNPQNRSIIMSSVENNRRNSASSVLNMVENTGRCLGMILTVYIFALVYGGDEASAYSFSTTVTAFVAFCACFLGIYLAAKRIKEFK